jgi:hypothetical protein
MGSVAGGAEEAGVDLMGTVFAVSSFSRDGGTFKGAGGGKEGGLTGGAIALVGNGVVCWVRAFTNAVRDIFFVGCCADVRGDVTIVEWAVWPANEETAGAFGPIITVFLS